MKAVTKTLFVCSLFLTLTLIMGTNICLAQEMTMKEYNAQLQEWANRETAAQDEIAKLDGEIENLKSQMADIENQNKDVWAQIYQAIGTTETEVNGFRSELNDLDRQLNALGALSPEELFKRRKELDAIEEGVQEHKNNRIAVLTEMQNKISALEGKIAQLRSKMPKGMYDEYTVVRGDYLWRISKKSDIYGDPLQWIRIYSYNKEQINDPDLIYPDQIFKIHRENGPNEFLVGKGDNLSKIAGNMEVLGDPTKWREIYEANKTVIGDEPGLIYPYQIIKIPR